MDKQFLKDKRNFDDAKNLCEVCRANGKVTCNPDASSIFARCGSCGKVFCSEQGDIAECLCEKCSTGFINNTSTTPHIIVLDEMNSLLPDNAKWKAPDGKVINVLEMWITLENIRRINTQMNYLLTGKNI